MLVNAVLASPYAFLSLLFVPEYWEPVRIVNLTPCLEDILFSFSSGALAWPIAVLPIKNRIVLDFQTTRVLKRYITTTFSGLCLLVLCRTCDLDIMSSANLSMAILGILLLLRRVELWPIPVTGAIGFGILYTLLIGCIFAIWPDFILQWNTVTLWSIRLFSVPLGEIIWSLGYGAVWPLLMAYLLDAKVAPLLSKNESINAYQASCTREKSKILPLPFVPSFPRRRLYPPACKPYGLEAEPEATRGGEI